MPVASATPEGAVAMSAADLVVKNLAARGGADRLAALKSVRDERLREHMDTAYGSVTSTEAAPTPCALARVDALERELKEHDDRFAALKAGDAAKLNAALRGPARRRSTSPRCSCRSTIRAAGARRHWRAGC